ncbi:hypothetical protein AMATHDRAFT_75412 [Amanita thiersii Skay4041]|uniref:Signal recognition particle subunit SRP68 n=1 Tax=Amanita thiersii Skay4041 TaxID=703135 RepID=A0A2A9NSR2_9AGAR|nr:hypothetical protein AMATHDRAFT_75412 [Amanita thiersii Skay4041]
MTDTAPSPVLFKTLQLVNEQRNAYGLRYNDFNRYRKHCANRTHRLRSTLKMTHGKGREFKRLPPLNPDIVHDGHLQLLLLESERAWSYAQELYSASLQPVNQGKAGTLRHSATGRFRRAVHWTTQLLSHCQTLYTSGRLSAENLIQGTIYTLTVNGQFLRYRDEFEDALSQLSVARSLLDHLIACASTSRDQALAILFADEIAPEIRHCAHELGREKAYDIEGIVSEIAPLRKQGLVDGYDDLVQQLGKETKSGAHGESRKQLREINWEGQPVPVRNPELVDVLLKVQEEETKLSMRDQPLPGESLADKKKRTKKENKSKKGVAAYDAILLVLSDAESVTQKLAEAQQLSGSASISSAQGGRDIHFVHAYITYQLLSRRIERDLLLVSAILANQPGSRPGTVRSTKVPTSKALKPEQVDGRLYPAVVRVLDTILQSLNQMRALSIVDDSPDLAAAVEARVSFTRARRCLYLARCYTPTRKYAEALTLIQHANIHIRETISTLSLASRDPISDTSPCFFPLNNTDMRELETGLIADGLQFKRDWFTYNGGALDEGANKTYKKPVFFNIALNYAELDMDRLLERAGKAVPAAQPAFIPEPKVIPIAQPPVVEKKAPARARVEEVRPATPEPQAPVRSGLSSLLGGWWGRS